VSPRGRPAHRGGKLTARRGERRDEVIAAGKDLAVGRQGTRRRMAVHVERRALRRAACRVGAQAGPVTPAIHAEQLGERDPGLCRLLAQRVGDERDGRVAAVPHGDRGADALGGQQADGVAGNGGGGPRAPRVREVIPERDPDLGGTRLGTDHDDAAAGGEAEQAGDDREQGRRRAHPHPRSPRARVQGAGDGGLPLPGA
jgi:hypothetical protein